MLQTTRGATAPPRVGPAAPLAIHEKALEHPDRNALTWVGADGAPQVALSHGELDLRARRLARRLGHVAPGARVVLLYLPEAEFVVGLLGSWYAGLVPVPAYPPEPGREERTVSRLRRISSDCGARVVLTSSTALRLVEAGTPGLAELGQLEWIASDADAGEAALERVPPPEPGSAALIQYTSGSTGDPKGVVLGHRALAFHLETVLRSWKLPDWRMASWLPMFHDMGLIGGILTPLYFGGAAHLLSPLDFLKAPIAWLRMISRAGATISGAPNFAYDLCVRRIRPEDCEGVDLSTWQIAFCGAEPVRHETMERFAARFEHLGLRRASLLPCYGLAENTLLVSGGPPGRGARTVFVDRSGLEAGRVAVRDASAPSVVPLVSTGRPAAGHELAVVDVESLRCAPEGRVGEIWVAGGSLGSGYWGRPELSREVFAAELAERPGRRFLRTGDLGFLRDGELVVTGRLKDCIIVRGSNHYPQDVEHSAERAHPGLRPGCGAAFQLEPEGGDGDAVAIVQEIRDPENAPAEEIFRAICERISVEHGLAIDRIALLPPRTLPKTTSGKVQRRACRERLVAGDLPVCFEWTRAETATPARTTAPGRTALRRVLASALSERLGIPEAELDPDQTFGEYGLGSGALVELVGELEAALGRPLEPHVVWEHPSIARLAGALASDAERPEAARPERARDDEPLAIVGMAARFPGAPTLSAYWSLVSEGRSALREVPEDRFPAAALFAPDAGTPGKVGSREGGFLEGVDLFDFRFFRMSRREACRMDPQQRIALELAWEALLDASLAPESIAGARFGVFVGASGFDYASRLGDLRAVDAHTVTGNAHSVIANRISYLMDARGPSVCVDTACSSSLVALHMACQSVRSGESTAALAGGVNLILAPTVSVGLTRAGVIAEQGGCKPFDAAADGIARSEGAGFVVIKRLRDALADGDRIYALVRGGAVNNDGRTNSLTAPSLDAQVAVIRAALASADLEPDQIDYVEAHGTGTRVGDAIEARALGRALGARARTRPLRIGSIKANIGHAEAAAGVAGVIKAALALFHGRLPPHRFATGPSAGIAFEELGLEPARAEPWTNGERARRAGVSSFGFGGTNAHVVLEAAGAVAPAPARRETRGPLPFALAAHGEGALDELVGSVRAAIAEGADLPELAAHLALARPRGPRRIGVLADSRETLLDALDAAAARRPSPHVFRGAGPAPHDERLAMVFSGLGSQYPAMALDLARDEPVVAECLECCADRIRERAGWSLMDALAGRGPDGGLDRLEIVQPCLFAVQVSLAALWRSWGITPDAVVGHSLGEVAAAHVAGALSLADGVAVICARSELLGSVADRGRMAVVGLAPAEVHARLETERGEVAVAGANAPRTTILAGSPAELERLGRSLQREDVFFRLVSGNGFGHCRAIEPLRPALEERLAEITSRPPEIELYSTVSGDEIGDTPLDAAYWGRNLCEPVRFLDATRRLLDRGVDRFLEVSPHPILLGPILDTAREAGVACSITPSLAREAPGQPQMLGRLLELYAVGRDPDWRAVLYRRGAPSLTVPIPWQRERCWLSDAEQEPRGGVRRPGVRGRAPLLLREHETSGLDGRRGWECALRADDPPFLADHRVQHEVLVPTTAYVEILLEVAEALGLDPAEIHELELGRGLFLDESEPVRVHVVVEPEHGDAFRARVLSVPEAATGGARSWREHATARLVRARPEAASAPPPPAPEGARTTPAAAHYAAMDAHGIQYGPRFRGVRGIETWGDRARASIDARAAGAHAGDGLRFHPAVLDACLQVVGGLAAGFDDDGDASLHLPVRVGRIRVPGSGPAGAGAGADLESFAVTRARDGRELAADVVIVDAAGATAAVVEDFRLRRVGARDAESESWLHRIEWVSAPRPDRTAPLPPGAIAVLGAGSGLQAELSRALAARGHEIVTVAEEAEGRRIAELARLPELRAVVLCLHPGGAPAGAGGPDLFGPSERVLRVQQALARAGWRTPGLWIVTESGAGAPAGEVAVGAARGLARTAQLEHAETWGGLIEVDAGETPALARQVADEICAPDSESQLRITGSGRHTARLRPHALPPARPRFEPAGTYLITGGTGGLGLRLAEWLAAAGARRLVLVGRTPLPSREQWPRLDPGDRRCAIARAIERIELHGASARVAAVDVADREDLEALLDDLRASAPPIRGIFHAAGVSEQAEIRDLDGGQLRRVGRAKLAGAWNLHALSEDLPVRHFVVYSSGAGVWGSKGLAAYAAANAGLDALVAARRAAGLPGLGVCWGMWGEVGMAASEHNARMAEAVGLRPMPPGAALELLGAALAADPGHLVVASADWSRLRSLYEIGSERRRLLADLGGAGRARAPEPDVRFDLAAFLALEPDERGGQLRGLIERVLAARLRIPDGEIGRDSSMQDLGVDSLVAVELKHALEKALGIDLPVVALLRDATLDGIAADLAALVADAHSDAPPDLQREATLAPEICAGARTSSLASEGAPLLTGATGFLGGFLLRELLERHPGELLCLVRADDESSAQKRIRASLEAHAIDAGAALHRVRPVLGDLERPDLGLGERGFARLAQRTRAIYHSGAWLNAVYPYARLRAANVDGVRSILRLASAGRTLRPLHYISTIAVLPWGGLHPGDHAEEREAVEPVGLPVGYCETKWVAERLVLEAARRGLPATVYRPGFIAGASDTGVANVDDLLCRLVRGCVRLGLAPDVTWLQDMTPVDYVSRAVLELSRASDGAGRIYHLVNPQPMMWRDLVTWIDARGHRLELVPYAEWLARVEADCESSPPNALAPLLPLFQRDPDELFGSVRWDDANARAALEPALVRCLPVAELLDRFFGFLEETGFLPAPAPDPG